MGFLLVQIPAFAGLAHWPNEWKDATLGSADIATADDDPAPFNTATADDEMRNGRLTWHNVSGKPHGLVLRLLDSTISMSEIGCPNNSEGVNIGEVWIRGCPINGAGEEFTGFQAGTNLILNSLVKMDTTPSGFTWHISSSTTVPAGKLDLRGAVAHEVGHSIGAEHIDIDCEAVFAQTMCPFHSFATAKYRSAQAHEVQDWKDQHAN